LKYFFLNLAKKPTTNPFLPGTANQIFNFVLDHLNRNRSVH